MLVQDLKWSPTEAFRLAVCLSDGTMMVVDVAEKVVPVGQLPASVGITCGECVCVRSHSLSHAPEMSGVFLSK